MDMKTMEETQYLEPAEVSKMQSTYDHEGYLLSKQVLLLLRFVSFTQRYSRVSHLQVLEMLM